MLTPPALHQAHTKMCARPEDLTEQDLETLRVYGGEDWYHDGLVKRAAAIDKIEQRIRQRDAIVTKAAATPVPVEARPVQLTPDQLAEVLVFAIKGAITPRDAKIAALQQDVRQLSDRVVQLEAQLAAQREPVEP
jgi:hypothetical protein